MGGAPSGAHDKAMTETKKPMVRIRDKARDMGIENWRTLPLTELIWWMLQHEKMARIHRDATHDEK